MIRLGTRAARAPLVYADPACTATLRQAAPVQSQCKEQGMESENVTRVNIIGIRMPFWSMVIFMVKGHRVDPGVHHPQRHRQRGVRRARHAILGRECTTTIEALLPPGGVAGRAVSVRPRSQVFRPRPAVPEGASITKVRILCQIVAEAAFCSKWARNGERSKNCPAAVRRRYRYTGRPWRPGSTQYPPPRCEHGAEGVDRVDVQDRKMPLLAREVRSLGPSASGGTSQLGRRFVEGHESPIRKSGRRKREGSVAQPGPIKGNLARVAGSQRDVPARPRWA